MLDMMFISCNQLGPKHKRRNPKRMLARFQFMDLFVKIALVGGGRGAVAHVLRNGHAWHVYTLHVVHMGTHIMPHGTGAYAPFDVHIVPY
jgi:hypothetical protein